MSGAPHTANVRVSLYRLLNIRNAACMLAVFFMAAFASGALAHDHEEHTPELDSACVVCALASLADIKAPSDKEPLYQPFLTFVHIQFPERGLFALWMQTGLKPARGPPLLVSFR
ncbi:MAG: hypothetical protein AAGD92_14475 [Pseudomonadota bacterium]